MSAKPTPSAKGVAHAGDAFFVPVAPRAFLLLLAALSLPFWLTAVFIMPDWPGGLPLSALSAALPLTAALIPIARREGRRGVVQFLRRIFDRQTLRKPAALALALLLLPAVVALAHGARALAAPIDAAPSSPLLLLMLVPVFLAFAIGEEAGWTGILTAPLVQRFGFFGGALVLGLLWAAWHFIPFLQTGRGAAWIAWQSGFTILARMILVWLYFRTGRSIAATVLAHAAYNLAWIAVPTNGSHYDPAAMTIAAACVAAALFAFARPPRN